MAQGGQRQTASAAFDQQRPGSSSGAQIHIDYRNPGDASAKPFAVRKITTRFAPGTVIDTSVPTRCVASDAQLMAAGPGACPAGSVVGGGQVSLSSTGADPTTSADVTLLNGPNELIFVTTAAGIGRLVIHSPTGGNTITTEVPRLPGGPPDGVTAIRTASLTLRALSQGGRNYITTPPSCPAGNRFTGSVGFDYFDGVSQSVSTASPCIDIAPPTVRLIGVSRRCVRGALRGRVRVSDTSALRAVAVRLNGRRIASTQRKSFRFTARRAKLRRGRNHVTVTAVDARRNRFVLTRRFVRCG